MSSAVVYDFNGLRMNALDADVDLIFLAADIEIESGGIEINKNKPSLVIDGFYPQDETGVVHTITDCSSLSQNDSIRVGAVAGDFELTLKNCVFVGKNFYGAISSVNSSLNSNVILCLDNVTYSGPQAIYHRRGQTLIIGGSYHIGAFNGATVDHETFETNSLRFFENVDIHHESSANSCFWLCNANPQFIVSRGAVVNLETDNREMIYADGGTVNFVIEEDGALFANIYHGMFYNTGMSARSIVLEQNAQLVIDQKVRRSSVPTVLCSGNLSVGENSRLLIIRKFSAQEPLIRFSSTATAQFVNPKSVVLYNPSGRLISFNSGTGTVDISAQMVRYWLTAADISYAGGFDDIPLYHWAKADGQNATILATASSSATTAVSTNLVLGVDAPVVPTVSTFSLYDARVLAFGSLSLTAQPTLEMSLSINGTTDPNALIRVDSLGAQTETEADESGEYRAMLVTPMSKGQTATIFANQDFKTVSIEIMSDGELMIFSLPSTLPFRQVALPVRALVGKRVDPDWTIVIRDSRVDGTQWYLYAQAEQPFLSQSAQMPLDTLVFKQAQDVSQLSEQVLVYVGEGNTQPDYTDTFIYWQEIEGILLSLNPLYSYEGGHYSTEITFTLSDEPL